MEFFVFINVPSTSLGLTFNVKFTFLQGIFFARGQLEPDLNILGPRSGSCRVAMLDVPKSWDAQTFFNAIIVNYLIFPFLRSISGSGLVSDHSEDNTIHAFFPFWYGLLDSQEGIIVICSELYSFHNKGGSSPKHVDASFSFRTWKGCTFEGAA